MPVSGDEVIWKILRRFLRIVSRRGSIPLYDVMRFNVFMRMLNDPRYSVLSYSNFVIIDDWMSRLAPFVRFEVYARQ